MRALEGPFTGPRTRCYDGDGMILRSFRAVRRLLRSPALIVGEIAAITFAGVLGAVMPQAGRAMPGQLGPVASAVVDALALDHVFTSAWFVAITLLATASLMITVVEQLRRLRRTWSQQLTEAHFQNAPYRVEFERPARSAAEQDKDADGGTRAEVSTKGRLGLAGSPLFHVGLLLLVVAGALRALFGVNAVVDVIEGETLPATAEAWGAQFPGALARPLWFDCPVTLGHVRAKRYESGRLRELRVRLSFDGAEGTRMETVAINSDLRMPGGRIFLGTDFGPAALVEWRGDIASDGGGARSSREAALMANRGKGEYTATSSGPGEVKAYLRARVNAAGDRPGGLEARVMKESALLFAGRIRVGQAVPVPGVGMLVLHGMPFWARLRGSRDPGGWLAYLGFALVIAGATIMSTFVKVGTLVSVTRSEDRERVVVALRAQRFAPLFRERFGQLVREEGGRA